jgi:hypothetical protein
LKTKKRIDSEDFTTKLNTLETKFDSLQSDTHFERSVLSKIESQVKEKVQRGDKRKRLVIHAGETSLEKNQSKQQERLDSPFKINAKKMAQQMRRPQIKISTVIEPKREKITKT